MPRLRLLAFALLVSLGAACAKPPPLPPPEVEYTGCREVLEPGTLCVLRSKRELRLWVRSAEGQRAGVRVDGKPLAATRVQVGAGERLTLVVPAGARKVDLLVETPAGQAAWSLDLVDANDGSRRDLAGEVFDQTLLTHKQLLAGDLTAARATLAKLRLPPKAPAESRYQLAFYRGRLAEQVGDYRSALAEIHRAVEVAERVKPERYLWLAEEDLALLLRAVGRSREAAQLFERLRRTPYAEDACEEGALLNNQAWSALLAREAGETLADPSDLLRAALSKYTSCDPPARDSMTVNAMINLALAHLQQRRPGEATEMLRRVRALDPHPTVPHALWLLDLQGRIALLDGRPASALASFAQLAELAAETGSFDGRLRAALGRARAQQALGDPGTALGGLDRAEALLDEQSRQVPVHQGRETFLGARNAVVSAHVELLLDQRRNAEALQVVRHARARVLRQLAHVDSLATLAPEQSARRTRLLTAYHQRRAALEARAADDWKLPADQLGHERAARRAQAEQVKGLLDEAFLILPAPRGRLDGELPAPRAGELTLVYHPLRGRGWVGFAADGRTVAAHRFELEPGPLPALRELGDRLLAPFADQIGTAARLRVVASGRLEGVDLHALPFGGDVLLARAPVVYGLDLPAAAGDRDRTPGREALLVTDPRDDLPGARQEARAVRQALAVAGASWKIEELTAEGAGADAVRRRLAGADLLHYAGHGSYSGIGGWESSLLLAGDTQLTLGDLLSLERVPSWVTLSGCDTGRSSDETPVASLGLAHAFLLAGARVVVASTRVTYDRDMPRFFAGVYSQWVGEPDLALAVQRAQLAWRRRDPQADWSSFRVFER